MNTTAVRKSVTQNSTEQAQKPSQHSLQSNDAAQKAGQPKAGQPTSVDVAGSVSYPVLAEMGVVRFTEISHYTLQQQGEGKDVLRVYYRRAPGSLLPQSRKYRFGRSTRTVRADSGSGGTQEVQEISPFLLKAIGELDKLVKVGRSTRDSKEQLVQSLEELQESVNSRIAALKADINRL